MKKFLSIILVLMLVFGLAACGNDKADTPDDTNDGEETKDYISESFNVGFLNGPTGIGAAYLMDQADKGNLELNYKFTTESDASVIASAVINEEIDVAAVPTNVAATLYNKTNGAVKIIAINTMGVLHILEKGDTIKSIADLEGKTIYATGQGANPEYVLNYILRENGLEPGEDVTIEYLASEELTTKMAAGEIDICMLPVPAATTVLMKNEEVRDALNLTDEWNKVSDSELTQGCIVARTDKFDPRELKIFLDEYKESIEFMSNEDNIDDAAAMVVEYGIVASDAVAKQAIPQSGLTCVTGADEMKAQLADYFQVLFDADPTSVGGKVPDDGIYYEAK